MTAEWTWLVYMAGDNNLEGAGRVDLSEMQKVGSTAQVNVLVQFDTEATAPGTGRTATPARAERRSRRSTSAR